jgi:small subunit ribosomal protein S4e
MPKSWPIKRKNIAFISKPNPGSFSRNYISSVLILVRDILGYSKTSSETKYIVNTGNILVNGKEVKDIKFPIGMFDIIEIKKFEEKYLVLFDEVGRLKLIKAKENLVNLKVSNKKLLKGNKFQLNFFNGYNILVDEKTFKKTNLTDTIIYDFEKKKVSSVVELKQGSFAYIFDGNYKGKFGLIKKFTNYSGLTTDVVDLEINGVMHTTSKKYCFAIGDKKEDIKRYA